jgi:NADH-quinone oxidoreductase subunit E
MRPAPPSTRPLASSSLPPARPAQPLTSSIPPQPGDARVNELKAQLVQARHELSNTQNELRAARGERDNLRAELGRAKARIDELELAAREAEERASAAAAAEPPKAPEPPALAPELEAELRSRIAELEAELEETRDKSAPRKKPAAAGLTSIKGIGPKFEKALRAAGISSVSQVAAWTDADITRVAKLLGIKAQRIQKENWVGTARSLSSD